VAGVTKKEEWLLIYTEDVKRKLDDILKAFENHIDGQNYFDIVYSKKVGYIWIVVNPLDSGVPEQLDTPEKMMDALFNDVINDVVLSPNAPASFSDTLTEYEKEESRRRIAAILESLGDSKDECLAYLDSYLKGRN